jgi:hypothetical protein
MKRSGILLFCISFLLNFSKIHAQCADSTQVQYGYCDPTWYPVCACNGKTYRNDCFARNAGIVNNNWYYGICDAVDFDFNPDPPTDFIDVDAIVKVPGFMNVQLMDRFGRIFYSNSFDNVSELRFQIYIRGFQPGMYFINIWCNDGFKVRKVIIPDVG